MGTSSKLAALCLLGVFLVGCVTTSGQIKDENLTKAEGFLDWQIEDLEGNVVSSGTVENGDVKLAKGIMVDVLILDRDDAGNIRTALMPLGVQSGPMMTEFIFQVYHDGVVYPGEKFTEQYVYSPDADQTMKNWSSEKWDPDDFPGVVFYDFGFAASAKVPFVGCMSYGLGVVEGQTFRVTLGDEYIFKINGPSVYQWRFK